MMMTPVFWLAVIELGKVSLRGVVSWVEVVWFVAGLLLLIGTVTAVFWWNRRSSPDPFV